MTRQSTCSDPRLRKMFKEQGGVKHLDPKTLKTIGVEIFTESGNGLIEGRYYKPGYKKASSVNYYKKILVEIPNTKKTAEIMHRLGKRGKC